MNSGALAAARREADGLSCAFHVEMSARMMAIALDLAEDYAEKHMIDFSNEAMVEAIRARCEQIRSKAHGHTTN